MFKREKLYAFLILAAFLICSGWILYYLSDWYITSTVEESTRIAWFSAFGSFIGGLTSPAFSIFAFLGVLFSINSQNRNSRHQQFESTFFSLLDKHDSALNKIINNSPSQPSIADKALSELKLDLDNVEKLNFHTYRPIVSYFITLYQVIKFVDESSKSFKEKKKYTSLLRSYIPSNVLMLLFFNCYVDKNSKGKHHNNYVEYKNKIEKYAMLEHISWKFNMWPKGNDSASEEFKLTCSTKTDVVRRVLDSYIYKDGVIGTNVDLITDNLKCNFTKLLSDDLTSVLSNEENKVKLEKLEDDIEIANKEFYHFKKFKELKEKIESTDISTFYNFREVKDIEKRVKTLFPDMFSDDDIFLEYNFYAFSVEDRNEKYKEDKKELEIKLDKILCEIEYLKYISLFESAEKKCKLLKENKEKFQSKLKSDYFNDLSNSINKFDFNRKGIYYNALKLHVEQSTVDNFLRWF